jgi:single-strand DNA-binding protein
VPHLNKALLIGHLGRDAEVKYTTSGQCVIRFSLATSEKWKGRDGQQHERTDWHDVVYFPKSEAVAEYLTKGKAVFVEGAIQHEEWTDKEGNKKRGVKIKAHTVQLMGGGEARGGQRHVSDEEVAATVTDDDVPF